MRVFFLSEKTCALSVGGAYLGLVDGFERSVELQPSPDLFCELKPLGDFLPVRFILDENFLISPPPQVRLYFSEDSLGIYFCNFLRADQSLRVLWQKRLRGTLLTLSLQGKLQLYFESSFAKIIDLPEALLDCTPEENVEGFLLRAKNAFALLSYDGEILVLSEGTVLSAGETLCAEVPFHDSLAHTAVCEWHGKELISCRVRTAFKPTEATFALALFESALIGADCTPFLSPELAEKASALKEYLGDYRSVVLTAQHDKIGLVYERKERVFDVRYFRVEISDGKVSNIKPI